MAHTNSPPAPEIAVPPLAEKVCFCVFLFAEESVRPPFYFYEVVHIASMSTPPGPTDPTIVFLPIDLPICRVVWGPRET